MLEGGFIISFYSCQSLNRGIGVSCLGGPQEIRDRTSVLHVTRLQPVYSISRSAAVSYSICFIHTLQGEKSQHQFVASPNDLNLCPQKAREGKSMSCDLTQRGC